jgi:hypothetical protein
MPSLVLVRRDVIAGWLCFYVGSMETCHIIKRFPQAFGSPKLLNACDQAIAACGLRPGGSA